MEWALEPLSSRTCYATAGDFHVGSIWLVPNPTKARDDRKAKCKAKTLDWVTHLAHTPE